MIAKIRNFVTEVTVELKKVSWPTRSELVGSTIVVILGVVIMAVAIGICDFIFAKTIHMLIR
jgi:preprotein translocase subunit SecE